MKTSVEIDDKKLELAKKMGGSKTLRVLIDEALDSYIQLARRKSMIDLLGAHFFEGDLSKMRKRPRVHIRR